MKVSSIVCSALLLAGVVVGNLALAHEAVSHGGVSFAEPHDGAVVHGEFKVEMKVEGMDVQAAGKAVSGTGHHHLIIDGDCITQGAAVPKDETHKHFGKGQTETMLTLAPGKHSLTLQFANGLHQSYGPDWCKTIHVTVE